MYFHLVPGSDKLAEAVARSGRSSAEKILACSLSSLFERSSLHQPNSDDEN